MNSSRDAFSPRCAKFGVSICSTCRVTAVPPISMLEAMVDKYCLNPPIPNCILTLSFSVDPVPVPAEVDMASTIIPSSGRAAMNIPTSGVGGSSPSGAGGANAARSLNKSRDRHQRPAVGTTAPSSTGVSHFSEGPENNTVAYVHGARQYNHQQQQQKHTASAFYFADNVDIVSASHPPTTELPAPPPVPAPEPGGGDVEGIVHNRTQQGLPVPASVASRSPYHRPWRKRAEDARRATVFQNTEGVEEEGGGSTGAMKRRASQKEAVVASRKESQQKAISRAAVPIVDLVGVVSPLVLLVGITLVQNVP